MAGRTHECRFLPMEAANTSASVAGAIDEFEESDIWGLHDTKKEDGVEYGRNTTNSIPHSSKPKKIVSRKGGSKVVGAGSLPVSVPDWSKILGDQYGRTNTFDLEGFDEEEAEMAAGGGLIPPHEYLWRKRRLSGVASMSVHEGIGRTLKGRDLSRVRNAVWEKTGFQD